MFIHCLMIRNALEDDINLKIENLLNIVLDAALAKRKRGVKEANPLKSIELY